MSKKREVEKKIHKKDCDCEKHIRKLERENKRLKAENKTLNDAIRSTDDYLVDMLKDRSVEEIVQSVKDRADTVVQAKCPNCGKNEMKHINLGIIKIVACTGCPYRNRLNESGPSQT